MHRDEVLKLSGRGLDLAVDEFMGAEAWECRGHFEGGVPTAEIWPGPFGNAEDPLNPSRAWCEGKAAFANGIDRYRQDWVARKRPSREWSASLDACAAVEAEVARRGLQAEYADHLWRLLGLRPAVHALSRQDAENLFRLLSASPADRCRAALLAAAAKP